MSSQPRLRWASGRSPLASWAARYSARAAAEPSLVPCEQPRRFDPDPADRVCQQRRDQARALLRRHALGAAERSEPHQRIRIAEAAPKSSKGFRAVMAPQRHSRGADDGRLRRIVRHRRQSRAGPGQILAPGVDRLGPVRPWRRRGAPPSSHRRRGPLRRALGVAVVAGVRRRPA